MGSGFPGAAVRRCNSEFVVLAMSAAVLAASCASLEPSVASRILVGKMLIGTPPLLGTVLRLDNAMRPSRMHPHARPARDRYGRTSENSVKRKFIFAEFPFHALR